MLHCAEWRVLVETIEYEYQLSPVFAIRMCPAVSFAAIPDIINSDFASEIRHGCHNLDPNTLVPLGRADCR